MLIQGNLLGFLRGNRLFYFAFARLDCDDYGRSGVIRRRLDFQAFEIRSKRLVIQKRTRRLLVFYSRLGFRDCGYFDKYRCSFYKEQRLSK
jgi:hypothetical protein